MFAISRTGIHANPEIQKIGCGRIASYSSSACSARRKRSRNLRNGSAGRSPLGPGFLSEERLQASYERHAVVAVLEAEDYRRLDDFVAPMLPTFCAET